MLLRFYLLAAQVLLIALAVMLLISPNVLIGDNAYVIGTRLMVGILAFALLGLALPSLVAILRNDVGAMRYLVAGQVILHAPMGAVFAYNIGAFDYVYFATGQTVFVWVGLWIVLFAAPTLFCFLRLMRRER